MAALLTSCGGGGEDKTLYGSWEFVQEMDDSTHQWKPYQEDFFVIVTGSCEEIDVELQHYGDLTDADKATNAKCYGNRDQLDFTEPRFENTFQCKMDATKDTLLCTSKRHYDSGIGVPEGGMDVVLQYKLARIQY
jgi:hypothetical protein